MAELIGTVQNVRQHINPKLKIGGAFLTMANDTNFRKADKSILSMNSGAAPLTAPQSDEGGGGDWQ